jgi:hypothetical protein
VCEGGILLYRGARLFKYEIKNTIETRMEKYNPKNNISWEDIYEKIILDKKIYSSL